MDKDKQTSRISVNKFVLMILTSVFGVVNIGLGYFNMGYAAIPFYIVGGLFFFLPFAFMMVELATAYSGEKGGIYTWMQHNIGVRWAFVGIMMWYVSYIIWMFGKALNMWVPLSIAIFGKDLTVNVAQWQLGLAGIAIVIVIALIVSLGAEKLSFISSIGGLAVVAMNAVLIFGGLIALLINGGFEQPITGIDTFFAQSANPNFTSMAGILGFLVFAIFAYGGIEALAGSADDLENPKKNIKKGITIAAIFVIVCYILGYLMVGAVVTQKELVNTEGLNQVNALYAIMYNLGNVIAGDFLGQVFQRFAAVGMFLAYVGAFIALTYAPLKQLVEGTPKEFWPKSFTVENKVGIRINAVKVQAVIVIIFIAVKVIASEAAIAMASGSAAAEQAKEAVTTLFNNIVSMTNVAMTLPYLFLIVTFYVFKTKQNKSKQEEEGIKIFKSKGSVIAVVAVTFAIVAFANVFTIVQPIIDNGAAGIESMIWQVAGPIIFGGMAMFIYWRSTKKTN